MPATWYNADIGDENKNGPMFEVFQRYITNHARSGNPNTPGGGYRDRGLVYWPEVNGLEDDVLGNVFNVSNSGFEIIRDQQMRKRTCDVWTEALIEAVEGA